MLCLFGGNMMLK
jgi:hypothetical protein